MIPICYSKHLLQVIQNLLALIIKVVFQSIDSYKGNWKTVTQDWLKGLAVLWTSAVCIPNYQLGSPNIMILIISQLVMA